MTTSNKPESLPRAMRERLLTNRYGRLTVNQWVDVVTQPLVAVLVLFIPLGFMLLPRLLVFARFGGLWGLVVVLAALALVLLPRAYRYARLPVEYAELTADAAPPAWAFWRAPDFAGSDGKPLRFGLRLAPALRVDHGRRYLVYYMRDGDRHILLSAAPADHPDAAKWQPTGALETRLKRRSGTPES